MKFKKFIAELQRRNVFKATIAYLAVAWVIIQIASIILPAFDAPGYVLKVLIYVLSFGLVFWIGFSWIYDLTPDGLQKTEDNLTDVETAKLNDRRLNRVIVGALLIAVLLLTLVSFWAGSQWNSDNNSVETKRVAVLPLLDQTAVKEEAYFKNGMTEGLIDQLSKVDQLRIINLASASVLAAGVGPSNMMIEKEIKTVDYFILGTFEREDHKLHIALKLQESLDSKPEWQKRYSRDISEVRRLWAEAAADLSAQMGVTVEQEDLILWSGLRPVQPETYELYLKGKHYLNKSTSEDWNRGLVYMHEAKDRNPADPYAYAGLAEGYITVGHNLMPPPDVFPKAEAAAKRAIQLDSTNAEGWAALAHYHTYFGWDWQLAEYAFNKANELNPNMAYNHYHRAWYLALFGRMNEAIEEHKKAQELDPFTPLHFAWLGELYRWVGLYEEGLVEAEKAAQTQADYALSMFVKGRVLLDQGNTDEGLEALRQAARVNSGWKYMGYGPALIRTGHREEGRAIIKELEAKEIGAFFALCLSHMYVELKEYDKAFEWLPRAKRHAFYPWIRVMIKDEKVLKDPRFLELIREMNLPDPAPLDFDPNA